MLVCVCLLAFACATNRSGPRPSARIVPADSIDASTLIEYRPLTREDFRAAQPPPASRERSNHLGALLCGSIGGESDLILDFQTREDGSIRSFAFKGADYRARMDPECSWWNAEQNRVDPGYVLEHEQIHFGLLEVSARQVNRVITRLRIRVTSRDQAVSRAEAKLRSVLEAAREKYLEQSRRFDEQTSPRPDREAQARWRRVVEARLLELR